MRAGEWGQIVGDDMYVFSTTIIEDADEPVYHRLTLYLHKRFGQFHALLSQSATFACCENGIFHQKFSTSLTLFCSATASIAWANMSAIESCTTLGDFWALVIRWVPSFSAIADFSTFRFAG